MGSDLKAYLEPFADRPFDWACNNCMGFVSGWLEAVGLDPLPEAWCVGYADTKQAVRQYRKCLADFGHDDIIGAIDARFDREVTLHPRDGMLCARAESGAMGYGFGICYMQQCVFLTDEGARLFQVEPGDKFWSVE